MSACPDMVYRVLSAGASTNAANISPYGCKVWRINGFNNKAAAVFLKLYNKAETAPTVGTDVPVITIRLTASAFFDIDLRGLVFDRGLGIAMTGAAPDNDTTALVAGDIVCLNLLFD